jgi:dihydrofolate reductase
MGKVIADFTMSLDGFIADLNDDIRTLFGWYFSGDVEVRVPDGMVFRLHKESATVFQEAIAQPGAFVTGRRDFDVSRAWGGQSPTGAPIFIVTHSAPAEWSGPDSPFTFVTDGVAGALEQARQVAGDRDVAVSGSTIVQQCLQAGWLDEIQIHLAPVLLGAGVRLFDHLGTEPRRLEIVRVIAAPDVTHLSYRVINT